MNFGEKLALFLKQRNMKIVELSQFIGLDRANLYKIVKGTRKLPDKSYIQPIAEILCLTKEETNELYEAYEIDEVGSYVYYRRKKVEEILKLSISWDVSSPISLWGEKDKYNLDIHDFQYFSGQYSIDSILSQMMLIETKKENPHIRIFNQIKNDYIMNTIQFLGNMNSQIVITHIFGMNNSLNQNENEYYNLDYLISIFPILSSNLQYHPYYFRTYIPYASEYSFFSNVVITSDYVFTFTNDYQDAIIYNNQNMINIYRNMFQKYLKKSQLLINKMDYIDYCKSIFVKQELIYTTPCPTHVLGLDEVQLVSDHIRDEFSQKSTFMEFYRQYLQMQQIYLKNNTGNTQYYFTKQGLEYFCETGYFHDIPASLLYPLTHDELLYFLGKWKDFVENYQYITMLDIPAFPGDSTTVISFDDNRLSFTFITSKGIPICVTINEASIYSAFHDYFHHIIENKAISKEETINMIDEYIQKLEKQY
ncbi:MAG: helix-turn-helix transcriptional regulator [Erysipelotrichaceae bacterium]|nr:helix-turn-helix transcriptional regulator [Erysipelotrichaceae bacterium]